MLATSFISSEHSSLQLFDSFNDQELEDYDFDDTVDVLLSAFYVNDEEQETISPPV